jgi:hypothetical protein
MPAKQLELFSNVEDEKPIEYWWEICWGWEGPEIGGYCEVNNLLAKEESGNVAYHYCETCKILDRLSDGNYLVIIAEEAVTGRPFINDGTKLILPKENIWPPVKVLSEIRHKE